MCWCSEVEDLGCNNTDWVVLWFRRVQYRVHIFKSHASLRPDSLDSAHLIKLCISRLQSGYRFLDLKIHEYWRKRKHQLSAPVNGCNMFLQCWNFTMLLKSPSHSHTHLLIRSSGTLQDDLRRRRGLMQLLDSQSTSWATPPRPFRCYSQVFSAKLESWHLPRACRSQTSTKSQRTPKTLSAHVDHCSGSSHSRASVKLQVKVHVESCRWKLVDLKANLHE